MSGEMGKALAKNIKTRMPREQLEEYLGNLFKQVRMCTLVTSRDDVPRGTPLEYFADGLILYCSPDPGIKTRNLKTNTNVSVSICNTLHPDWETEWETVWGVQVTGKGETFEDGAPEHTRGIEVIDFKGFLRALGMDDSKLPEGRKILKITPSKIELTDFSLIAKGFATKQVWEAKE